ncbi:MAG: imidazolonepropionase [Burkholderiaceae bacterium]|nr:imidazolonepropionase [Burkholderiaceae bacterium]
MESTPDLVIEHCSVATMAGPGYGAISDAAIAIAGDRIAWVGRRAELPARAAGSRRHDARGAWITPGLVDCHTHLVYGGDRAHEFELRLQGASYEEIARAGGGIVSTVAATRAATEAELVTSGTKRLRAMLAEGVTTVEIKSGYGLSVADELKMLRAARALGQRLPVHVETTLLAAHALPPEFAGRAEAYIDLVCDSIVPAAASAGLADAVDAFCEGIGFSAAQCARVFDAAGRAGLPVKLHADQLSDLGGAALAATHHGLSADHLEFTSADGIAAMAAAGTVAVLLPGAFYFIRETQLPPIEALRTRSVPIAIATDCNPGSSPIVSPLATMNLACTMFRITPEEALAGFTLNGARALGRHADRGSVEAGKRADLAAWDIRRPGELAYVLGANPLVASWLGGQPREQY